MPSKPDILAPCQRCFQPFLMRSDIRYLSDYCNSCVRILGYRLTPQRQAQVNAGWRHLKATGMVNRIPEYAPDTGSRGPLVIVGRYADALKVAAKGGK